MSSRNQGHPRRVGRQTKVKDPGYENEVSMNDILSVTGDFQSRNSFQVARWYFKVSLIVYLIVHLILIFLNLSKNSVNRINFAMTDKL